MLDSMEERKAWDLTVSTIMDPVSLVAVTERSCIRNTAKAQGQEITRAQHTRMEFLPLETSSRGWVEKRRTTTKDTQVVLLRISMNV